MSVRELMDWVAARELMLGDESICGRDVTVEDLKMARRWTVGWIVSCVRCSLLAREYGFRTSVCSLDIVLRVAWQAIRHIVRFSRVLCGSG